MDMNMDGPSVQPNRGTERHSSPGKTTLLENRATVAELVNEEAVVAEKSCNTIEEGRSKNSIPGQKMSFQEHALIEEHGIRQRTSNDVTDKLLVFPLEAEAEKTSAEEMQISTENGIHQSHPETAAKRSRGRPRESSEKSTKGKHVLKSVDGTRVLRSRLQEKGKGTEPSNNLQGHSTGASGENRRKRKKKKKQMKNIAVDEFSKTRTHLRYLLHRMAYEQNFIDAYAGEGWKGQSAEKLRPEKELQRAKSEIFRCKLKIRDLFQHIDLSIAEGRLPQSLFDSEGEIDSEDIFCSKCGLKDVTLNNDIILCDGACERAFHQFCVQPPLLKEDIPDDDEGWLCPGCDCKDDCLDLLNESQGTNLSILDSWEKVYPEAAAAAAAGKTLDNNLELPSDDSEDNDYKPDDSEVEEKNDGDESSSDESDIYSASEDSGVAPTNEQNLQLPSDDSEDDDFDPDAVDVDEEAKQESSESDFTSDSEDLNLVVGANGSPHENLTTANEFMSEQSKVGRGKRPSLNDELSSLLETATNQGESAVISVRREVERLDYKKLYDEQYGDVSTDPSDEEYLDDADAPKRRRKNNTNSEKSLKRRGRKKLDTGGTNDSPIKSNKVPSESGSSNTSAKTSAIRRLGEATTQGLLMSFKENQNPERASKEKLAAELGITTHRVTKWFANARWSFRHMPSFASKLADIPSMGTLAQIKQSDVRLEISAAVKSGEQSEEPSDVKADMPIDNTTNSTNSLEDHQKVEKRTRLQGRKSTKSTGNKGGSHLSSNNIPSNKDRQKSHGPGDVSNAPVKKRRGRPKKSEI